MIVNTHQAEAWNGYEGTHWATHPDRYNARNDAFNPFLLEAVRAGRPRPRRRLRHRPDHPAWPRARPCPPRGSTSPSRCSPPPASWRRDLTNVAFTRGDAQVLPFPDVGVRPGDQ